AGQSADILGILILVELDQLEDVRIVGALEGAWYVTPPSSLRRSFGGEVFGAAFIAENDFEDDTPAPVAGCAAGSEDFAERPGRIVEFGPSTVRALRVQTRPCPGVRPEKYVRADTEERLLASGRFRA